MAPTAGYSGTPLVKKLGVKPAMRLRIITPRQARAGPSVRSAPSPPDLLALLAPLPEDVTIVSQTRGPLDLIVLFAATRRELDQRLSTAKRHLAHDGMLWIAWPKKATRGGRSGSSSSRELDGNEIDGNSVRRAGLEVGLVDVKVCAIDERWSGLKFMYRRADR